MPNNTITHAEQVTPAWALKQLDKLKISQSRFVRETGINHSNISCWLTGKRKMTKAVKCMFFYYFKFKWEKSLIKEDGI